MFSTDLFILSDQLPTINIRPLDAYLGYTDHNEDIIAVGHGIQAQGSSSSSPATLMRTQTGPQAAAYSEAGDQGDATLPAWDEEQARTVSLSEEAAEETASESGLHGGVGEKDF